MRLLSALAFIAAVSTALQAQTLGPKPSTLQHVTVEATTSAPVVAKGGAVTLWADVTPKPNIHVYASGAKDFTPVTLVLTPQSGVTIGKVKFPIPEMSSTVGVSDPVPVYRKPFRLTQPINVPASAKSGEVVTIAGVVNYQACDDKVCYPTASVPISWTVNVK
jgi:DsbC/DsbD-like thiol-disulfide interchange protein